MLNDKGIYEYRHMNIFINKKCSEVKFWNFGYSEDICGVLIHITFIHS